MAAVKNFSSFFFTNTKLSPSFNIFCMPCIFRFTNLWTRYLGHPVFRCTKNDYGPIKRLHTLLGWGQILGVFFFFLYRISIVINKKPILTFNGNIHFWCPLDSTKVFFKLYGCSSVFSAREKTTQLISTEFVKNIHTRWSQTPAYNDEGVSEAVGLAHSRDQGCWSN